MASPTAKTTPLLVVTQNLFLVPNAPRRKERCGAFCAQLPHEADIIAIQEIFVPGDVHQVIQAATTHGFLHHHYFRMGPGFLYSHAPGLLVLSKHPLRESAFHTYTVNGKPHKLHHIDWWFAKGVGLVRVQGPHCDVDVYITHLISCYVPWDQHFPQDEYEVHRAIQALECARWIQHTRRAPLVILACDMNAPPHTITHQIITAGAQLQDGQGAQIHTYAFKGCHCADPAEGACVDYILWGTSPGAPLRWEVSASQPLFHGAEDQVSDHLALRRAFYPTPATTSTPERPWALSLPSDLVNRLDQLMGRGLADASHRQKMHLARASLLWLPLLCGRWLPVVWTTLFWLEVVLAGYACEHEKAAITEQRQQLRVLTRTQPSTPPLPPGPSPLLEWLCIRLSL